MKVFLKLVLCALSNGVCAEAAPKPVPQPSYQVVLDAAQSCNQKELGKYPWDPTRGFIKIAEKARVIVDSIQLTEPKRETKPRTGIVRTFNLNYKLYATIACGEETLLFDTPNGKQISELPVIRHAWEKPHQLDIVSDSPMVDRPDRFNMS